ncbi:unnamed protein product [Rhizoctonia solani]|uniref:Uncharacterized protein n=1 Tax=Rhizoctonia solani TaxID=456999 RepID=A0A8H3A4Q6_9AGAM|nr:unnamed protein product [Rhizoctonia solani]
MGIFEDAELGRFDFEEGSETLSNADEGEEQVGPAGQANPTTGSAFNHIDMSGVIPCSALLAFVEGCCKECRLLDKSMENAMQTARLLLDYMAMHLFTHVLELGQDSSKTKVKDFFQSPTFKLSIKQQIQGRLLDPHIPFYVCGCTAQFVRHMRLNPRLYDLLLVVQQRLMNTKKFSSAVGEILSGFHGELRCKILGSIEDKTDIASTAKKLVIEGYLLSEDHIKQFALLQYLSEDYLKSKAEAQAKKAKENANAQAAQERNQGRNRKQRIDGAPQKALAFWTYIDTQMYCFRQYPLAKRNDYLKKILRLDKKKYPDPAGQARYFPPANQLLVPQWQSKATNAVQVMAQYTLTAAQEGQEATPAGPGATDEGKGPAHQEGAPKQEQEQEQEQEGLGKGKDDPTGQVRTGAIGNLQVDDSPFQPDHEMTHPSTHQHSKTAPALMCNANLGSVQGNHTPQGQAQQVPSNPVGPIQGVASEPQNGRVITLAQTSQNSPFPLGSRQFTPHVPWPPTLGTARTTRSVTQNVLGMPSNTGGQGLPVVGPYNPVDSKTAAATVGI